jgi:arginase
VSPTRWTNEQRAVTRPLGLIGVPSSAGAYAPGQEQAPAALREAGLVERLTSAGIVVVDHGDGVVWRWRPDREQPRAQNLGAVVSTIQATAERVRQATAAGETPLVLGGDCTVGLGAVAGQLAAGVRVGLVYFDLHPDLNVPGSVVDGALDWMGMAHMLGVEGALDELVRIGPRVPLLAPNEVFYLAYGPDQRTEWERQVWDRHGLRGATAADVAADPAGVAVAALATLEPHCDRLLIHFDVDVIDFTDAPLSENTGRNIGLPFASAFAALSALLQTERLAGLTITELNPKHGADDGSTLDRFVQELVAALANAPALAPAGD